MDESVLPFLEFNLSIHGRKAEVIRSDLLNEMPIERADGVVSNPPFNIPNNGYIECKTGNWAFVDIACKMTRGRAALILPNSVLTKEKDKDFVCHLLCSGGIEAVIQCPGKMFASTSIPVCVLVLNRSPRGEIVFVDGEKLASKETREQRGQCGEASHTGRIYRKEFSVFSDEAISQIVRAINRKESISFSKTVRIEDVTANDFNLNPLTYLPDEPETEQNKLEWIAEQYNAIVRQKNACKLVINETLAKELGLDQELWEQQKKNSAQVADMIGKLGNVKLEMEDYLTFTRSRELAIRFKSKDVMPEIFKQFVPMWVNRVALLNNLESEMLEQMRDYLMPLLLSGNIEVPELEE